MTNEEFTEEVLRYLAMKGVDLEGKDSWGCSNADRNRWWGPFCAVVSRYTHGKLSVGEIMRTMEQLYDNPWLHLNGYAWGPYPNTGVMSSKICRVFEVIEETKGNLTESEKEGFAFCVIYTECESGHDYETFFTCPVENFESFETIDSTFQSYHRKWHPFKAMKQSTVVDNPKEEA